MSLNTWTVKVKPIPLKDAVIVFLLLEGYFLLLNFFLDHLYYRDGSVKSLYEVTFIYLLPSMLIFLCLFCFRKSWPVSAIGIRSVEPKFWILALGLGVLHVVAGYVNFYISFLLGPKALEYQLVEGTILPYIYSILDTTHPVRPDLSSGVLVKKLFVLGFLAPLYEELMFRGVIQHGLYNTRLHPFFVICIVSAFWALTHYIQGAVWVFQYFLEGILWGLLVLKSGSILPAFLAHSSSNLFWQASDLYLYLRFN